MTTRTTWDWKLYDSLSDYDQRIASTQGRGYTRQDACMVAAKEEAFMAGTPKEDLVMAALQNLHDQVLLSIAQAGLMAELLAGTAGSLMIKETKK